MKRILVKLEMIQIIQNYQPQKLEFTSQLPS